MERLLSDFQEQLLVSIPVSFPMTLKLAVYMFISSHSESSIYDHDLCKKAWKGVVLQIPGDCVAVIYENLLVPVESIFGVSL